MNVVMGDPTTFDILAFGQASAAAVNYVRTEINRAADVLTDFGRIGLQAAQAVFEQFHGEAAIRKAREISRRIGWVYKDDCVRPLLDLAELQSAMPVMQRWAMANPRIRELHNRQECAGYAGSYIDVYQGTIGADHYDYRRVMNGVLRDVEGEDDGPLYSIYLDELLEGDRHLDLDEKVDIFMTWDAMNAILDKGIDDPTSICGDQLV